MFHSDSDRWLTIDALRAKADADRERARVCREVPALSRMFHLAEALEQQAIDADRIADQIAEGTDQ